MPRQVTHHPLRGGLDIVTSPLFVGPGRMWRTLNYECAEDGYRRTSGYERYSGKARPSEAVYWLLAFDGTVDAAPDDGDTVTGGTSGATAIVLKTVDGTYVLGEIDGTFQDNETLMTGSPAMAAGDAKGTPQRLAADTVLTDLEYRGFAASHRRSLIFPVPGSGLVRGVWSYKGVLYAFRDNIGATAGVMHRATPTGWQAVPLGHRIAFDTGSREPTEGETVRGAISGATATLGYAALDKANPGAWDTGNAAGVMWLHNVSGTFQDNENLQQSVNGTYTTVAVSNGVASENTLPAGGRYEFRNENFGGQAATQRMYGVNGVGQGFQWDGSVLAFLDTGHVDDRPTHVAIHRDHLLLGYRQGSLIVSATGEPLSYDAKKGSAEIGCGQQINGLSHVGAGNTLIIGQDRMSVLYGTDSTDFLLADHSDPQTGGVEWTTQVVGAPLFLDNRGVRRFDVTDAYGNFVINTMTSDIQPFLDRQREQDSNAVGSMRVRSRDQYRVWFESGIGVCIYLGRGTPEISFLDFGMDGQMTLGFDDGETEPMQGEIVTGSLSGATARVDSVKVDSGTWAGSDAAGTLTLYDVTGEFRNDEVLQRGAATIARADGTASNDANLIMPRCSVSVEDSSRVERVYFGADNGFVYEANRGRSFDGREISHYVRLPFNHLGTPTRRKRFFKADLHLELESQIHLSIAALFEDGNNPDALASEADIAGGGGLWDESIYSDFYWDSPLAGYHSFDMRGSGRNASILIQGASKIEPPHTLNAVSVHWSPRGRER